MDPGTGDEKIHIGKIIREMLPRQQCFAFHLVARYVNSYE